LIILDLKAMIDNPKQTLQFTSIIWLLMFPYY